MKTQFTSLLSNIFQVANTNVVMLSADGKELYNRKGKGQDMLDSKQMDSVIAKIKTLNKPLKLSVSHPLGGYYLPDSSVVVVGPLTRQNHSDKEFELKVHAVNALLESFSFIATRLLTCNTPLPPEDMKRAPDVLKELEPVKQLLPQWLDVVLDERPHNSFALELACLDAVACGDALQYDSIMDRGDSGINGMLAYSKLRDMQNLAICHIVLCSRAAVAGGLSVEMAYTMADFLILTIERCSNEEQILFVKRKAGSIFARMVHDLESASFVSSKSVSNRSRRILETVQRYIYVKCDRLTIARELKLNADYLDRVLKQDMKMTLMECLRHERVKEAQKLLLTTDNSISEIALMLNFATVSHFSRIFRSICGVSPRVFRQESGDKMQNLFI